MAGRKKLHSFETGPRPGHRGKGEDVIEPFAIGPRRDHPGGEQAFDFGGEKQPVALPAPKQGRNPKSIAPEMQLALLHIPQRDGKLSAELLPRPFADDLPTDGE